MLEPGEEKIAEYYFIINRSAEFKETTELMAKYLLINFDEEFWHIYDRLINREISADEYMSKYGEVPIFQFNIKVE